MRLRFKGILLVYVALLSTFLVSSIAHAGSKSVTINVSCVVPTMIELVPSSTVSSESTHLSSQATPSESSFVPAQRSELGVESDGSLVHVNTNLGNNTQLAEETQTRTGVPTKLFSVTAI